jgi:hypothetical protein
MKAFILAVILLSSTAAQAQWSNTDNNFADSLHMPVAVAARDQLKPIVINSSSDGAYFVIWEDHRNYPTNKRDIYAQKYDKDGRRLWAEDGVPVASGPRDQYYTPFSSSTASSSEADYRNYSYAADDNNGGFFIAWRDDSVANRTWGRIAVQHVGSTGEARFGQSGKVVAFTAPPSTFDYSFPQVIQDGQNGFFLSFLRNYGSNAQLFAVGYSINGTNLRSYGGGEMNANAYITERPGGCGPRYELTFDLPRVLDYFIWPDKQGGCNVVMSMHGKTDGAGTYSGILGYNRLTRIKKDKKAIVRRRVNSIVDTKILERNYKKDSVVVLYQLYFFTDPTKCNNVSYDNFHIENAGHGYLAIDRGYDFHFAKGTTISTGGNINIDFIAASKRVMQGSSIGKFTPTAYALPAEIYDAIPYQLDSDDVEYRAIRTEPEGKVLDKVTFPKDTILASESYFSDFALKSSGSKIYATALIDEIPGAGKFVYLQHLNLEKTGDNNFEIKYSTGRKKGIVIGKEIRTGFGNRDINYDRPQISMDGQGNAVFYITDLQRAIRVSPVKNGTQLSWGSMGRSIGGGKHNTSSYTTHSPVLRMKDGDATGVIAWTDFRNHPPNTAPNIFIRHLNEISESSLSQPYTRIRQLPGGVAMGIPSYIAGSSKSFSILEVSGGTAFPPHAVAELEDIFDLGSVDINVFQHTGSVRKFQDTAYMNINYTIKPSQNPSGALKVRLFFSRQDFLALQSVDPTILHPGFLAVIQQPNNTSNVPSSYTPVVGEREITPEEWKVAPGGYYLQFSIDRFSNFFIRKNKKGDVVLSTTLDKEPFTYYPNPVDSELYISALRTNDEVILTDITNRVIMRRIVSSAEESIDVREIPSGVYLCTIVRSSGREVIKIVKR